MARGGGCKRQEQEPDDCFLSAEYALGALLLMGLRSEDALRMMTLGCGWCVDGARGGVANAKNMNPMNAIFLLNMLSGLFS